MYGDDDSSDSESSTDAGDAAEPVEPDPEAELTDYEAELVDVPEPPEAPEPPSVPDPTENLRDGDVPRYVRTYFWRTVLIVDYAIAAVAIGPMLAYFRGDVQLGAGVTASGLLAFGYAYVLYRRFHRVSAAHEETDEADETDETDEAEEADETEPDRDAEAVAEADP